jgi:hypothetical protein
VTGVYEPTREHIEATLDETRLQARLSTTYRPCLWRRPGSSPCTLSKLVADLLADGSRALPAGGGLRGGFAPGVSRR